MYYWSILEKTFGMSSNLQTFAAHWWCWKIIQTISRSTGSPKRWNLKPFVSSAIIGGIIANPNFCRRFGNWLWQ